MTRGLCNRLSACVITIAGLACAGGCSSAYYIERIEKTNSEDELFAAIDSLGRFRTDAAARKKLMTLLDDRSNSVRRRAARSLGMMFVNDNAERLAICKALIRHLDDRPPQPVFIGTCGRAAFSGLRGPEPSTRFEALQALWNFTGQDLGFDQQAWLDWVNNDMRRRENWPSTRPATPQSQPAGALLQVKE